MNARPDTPMHNANWYVGWMEDNWQAIRYALNNDSYLDQDSADFLHRLREEIPEAIKQGKRNNTKSELFKGVV